MTFRSPYLLWNPGGPQVEPHLNSASGHTESTMIMPTCRELDDIRRHNHRGLCPRQAFACFDNVTHRFQ